MCFGLIGVYQIYVEVYCFIGSLKLAIITEYVFLNISSNWSKFDLKICERSHKLGLSEVITACELIIRSVRTYFFDILCSLVYIFYQAGSGDLLGYYSGRKKNRYTTDLLKHHKVTCFSLLYVTLRDNIYLVVVCNIVFLLPGDSTMLNLWWYLKRTFCSNFIMPLSFYL